MTSIVIHYRSGALRHFSYKTSFLHDKMNSTGIFLFFCFLYRRLFSNRPWVTTNKNACMMWLITLSSIPSPRISAHAYDWTDLFVLYPSYPYSALKQEMEEVPIAKKLDLLGGKALILRIIVDDIWSLLKICIYMYLAMSLLWISWPVLQSCPADRFVRRRPVWYKKDDKT